MRKTGAETRRVLARTLAEDLRNVQCSGGSGTVGVTDPTPTSRKDITNGPTDFDLPPPV
jgi:hypothetical protein